ncbi:MAG: gliding motility-associated C-terminal domain-containing protein [Cyclobacteriaceae bacterium]|nr:gliding motility-associated C-terminal domain-containing protein [Cyclobacteriaceae bacterium]
MMKYLRIAIALFGLLLSSIDEVLATHLRAGEITVERVSCNGLTFRIKITAYTNTGSQVRFEAGTLRFGDGVSLITPRIENENRPELGEGIGYVEFTTTHTYPGPGRYTISYWERNRNAGILNIAGSVNTAFFLETVIYIDPFIGCDNSPRLLVPPIDKGCTGGAWYHNPGAYDPDGDSLSYEFTVPKQDRGIVVGNYRDPNTKEFYDKIGLDYSKSNETQDGPPTFKIDPVTGTIVWDAPGAPGEYNIAFRIYQWRKIGDEWKQIGYVTRDMQIIIEDCLNQRPELTVPQDVCVEAGTVINETILGDDPDVGDSLKIQAYSEVFQLNPSPATVTPDPAKFTAVRPATMQFSWATKCDHVKDQSYQVVFKISDKSSRGPSLVQFKTWRITVIAPKPIIQTATLNVPDRSATLTWAPYKCGATAETMEVWRRVDSFAGNPGPCVTGMPNEFGYTKIATLPIGTTTYKNENLASGAKYCYRLVAIFPPPKGGKSIVSDEICLPPFELDRSIITNVSIDKTSETNGEILVKWVPPLEIDQTKFPPPYSYEVYRAEGFSGKINIQKVSPGKTPLTQYLDAGMNSRDKIFNYRVLAFDNNNKPLDSSASASTVRLEITSKFQELELRWVAFVPWSNSVTGMKHVVYRGLEGDPLVQIAEVNPGQGFVYNDKGLDNSKSYCYRVETVGSYGNPNPAIPNELRNFSQIMCAQPDDKEKPCKPKFSVSLKGTDCSSITCTDGKTFSNRIFWDEPDPQCKLDIRNYNIYYAARVGDPFKKLELTELVTGTEFEHKNLPSYAGCYKISAVDRAGNESDLSESFCFDNCPNYELPNVFTPNGDKCNDLFSAYSLRGIDDAGVSDCKPKALSPAQQEEIQKKCARFVQKVTFTVFNRWGGEVFTYQSGGERTIYIDWDGRDNSGKDLSTGVYYYEAQVTFDVVDQSNRNKTIRGWVQIIR